MTAMQISERIRRALKADERTSTEIARLADMQAVNVRQFKAGVRELPLDTLVRLAKAVGLEITVTEKK